MERSKLISKIHLIHKDVRANIPYINSGGCGFFAIRAYRALKDLGIESEIRIEDSMVDVNKKRMKDVNSLDELSLDNLSFNHAWIRVPSMDINFDGKYISIEGEHFPKFVFGGTYTERELVLSLKYGSWNPIYNRSNNIKITKILEKILRN